MPEQLKIRFVAIIQPGLLEYQALFLAGSAKLFLPPPHELVFVCNVTGVKDKLLPRTRGVLAELGCPIIGTIRHDFFKRFPRHKISKFMGKPAAMTKAAEDTGADRVCWLDTDHLFTGPFKVPPAFQRSFSARPLGYVGVDRMRGHWQRAWKIAGRPVPQDRFAIKRQGAEEPTTHPRCFQGGLACVATVHAERFAHAWSKFGGLLAAVPDHEGLNWFGLDQVALTQAQDALGLAYSLLHEDSLRHYAGVETYTHPSLWAAMKEISVKLPEAAVTAARLALKPTAYRKAYQGNYPFS